MRDPQCAFCAKVADGAPEDNVTIIEPLLPVVPGHLLFVPNAHIGGAFFDPNVTARLIFGACSYLRDLGGPDCNLIFNVGGVAGQTVEHLHLHAIPRRAGDRVVMPWGVHQVVGPDSLPTLPPVG